jgi:hypothetical protein
VFDLLDRLDRNLGPFPDSEGLGHVGSHPLGQFQAGRRAAPLSSALDVGLIGFGNRREDLVVGQGGGEAAVEVGDGILGNRAHADEGFDGPVDGGVGDRSHPLGDV